MWKWKKRQKKVSFKNNKERFQYYVIENTLLRRYYFIGTFWGGISLFFMIGWYALIPLILAQTLYLIWIMYTENSLSSIETQISIYKNNKKEKKGKIKK